MFKEKTLAELGEEYEQAAKIVTSRIRAARKRLALLKNDRFGKEAYLIRCELNVLYRERRDALETARTLIGYYPHEGAACEEAAA